MSKVINWCHYPFRLYDKDEEGKVSAEPILTVPMLPKSECLNMVTEEEGEGEVVCPFAKRAKRARLLVVDNLPETKEGYHYIVPYPAVSELRRLHESVPERMKGTFWTPGVGEGVSVKDEKGAIVGTTEVGLVC